MDKFNFEDYRYLTPTEELVNALSSYEGVVPMFLKPFMDYHRYVEFLTQKGVYDKIQKENVAIRKDFLMAEDKLKYRRDELDYWLKDNPEFIDILNNAVKK